jgi:hypothetical protein
LFAHGRSKGKTKTKSTANLVRGDGAGASAVGGSGGTSSRSRTRGGSGDGAGAGASTPSPKQSPGGNVGLGAAADPPSAPAVKMTMATMREQAKENAEAQVVADGKDWNTLPTSFQEMLTGMALATIQEKARADGAEARADGAEAAAIQEKARADGAVAKLAARDKPGTCGPSIVRWDWSGLTGPLRLGV